MRIDPALRLLRSNPAPQHKAQAALERVRDRWLARAPVERTLAELEQYGDGAGLGACPMLDTLMAQSDEARALLDPLLDGLAEVLRADPLGHVPFRHQYQGGIAILQLAERGRASLSLVTYEQLPCERDTAAQSVCFADGERHESYLAGSARARIFEIAEEHADRAVLDIETRELRAGQTLSLVGPSRTKLVERVHGRLCMLRLGRTALRPGPSSEYRLSDGALLHRASGSRAESRDEMMMALLGRMGRMDAAPAIAAMTRCGSDPLRWQAVRECLALDTRAGFAALSAIAADAHDSLAALAGSLRAQLIEAHPQLCALELS